MSLLMGIDVGNARTGLALGDTEARIARPLAIIEVRDRGYAWLARQIARRAAQERVEGFVIGLPINMDGTRGPQTNRSERLAAALAAVSDLPIAFCDERLTSFVAEQYALTLPHRRRSEYVDDIAAAVILQRYLDAGGTPPGWQGVAS